MSGLSFFFFQAEDGIRDADVTGVQTCALPIWPHRGEQLEFLAHRRHHPGGIAAGIGRVPDRPHDPAVEPAKRLLGHGGKRVAVLLVPALADGKLLPIDREPGLRGGGPHDLDAFGNDLEADVVAGQDSDFQRGAFLLFSSSPRKRGPSDSCSKTLDSRFRGNDGWQECPAHVLKPPSTNSVWPVTKSDAP